MGLRLRPWHAVAALWTIGGIVGGVLLLGSAREIGAATSDSDCQVLLAGVFTDIDRGSSASREGLPEKGDNLEAAADEVASKKLRKALLRIAAVWAAAGEAKSDRAAANVIAKRHGEYAKGFTVISKALRECPSQGTQ